MTNEERKYALKIFKLCVNDGIILEGSPLYIACKTAKEALEQEPCKDLINRKELDKALYERFHEEDSPNNITDVRLGEVRNFIKNFPSSVNPQEPKTGHWKRISMDKYVQHAMAYYRCSECGKDIIGEHNYCPNCGAKMAESEE